ncbi:MAG: sigma-54-dependent Fis family transcriptional regulator [Planctomycetia bacterium]|nr:sigma-54-dependent Fis family transcriptional regulator [Planctomycetia bacterium]
MRSPAGRHAVWGWPAAGRPRTHLNLCPCFPGLRPVSAPNSGGIGRRVVIGGGIGYRSQLVREVPNPSNRQKTDSWHHRIAVSPAPAGSTMSVTAVHERAVAAIERIAGVSAWSQQVRDAIALVARHQSNVLIIGPSGTGKELIARAIHAGSGRAGAAFVPVDCAATTGTLFASHMFGHVKGAFTGASSATLGCFRAADGGTIFLDEIGEMELELQAKLLRVLQQRTVVPVGGHSEMAVNVRVLAATNRDLSAEVRDRRFREDLFYRLNVVAIQTVPLKDRPEDVPVLADRFLAELSVRHGLPACAITPTASEVLQRYDWPGNVRELENVLERAVLFSPDGVIRPESLAGLDTARSVESSCRTASSGAIVPAAAPQLEMAAQRGLVSRSQVAGVYRVVPDGRPAGIGKAAIDSVPAESLAGDAWPTLEIMERDHLRATMVAAGNNKSLAARMLGIDRSVLRRRLSRHGLTDG